MDRDLISREYPALRSAGVPLNSFLAEQLEPDDVGEAARELGMLHGKHIDLETHGEFSVLMDYAIHDIRHNGLNVIDRVLRDAPPAGGSIELRLLRSMQRARFTIYTVTDTEPGLGVHGTEGRALKPRFIADIGLSKSAEPGLTLATRIHTPGDGWFMTTGAALPVQPNAVDKIIRDMEAYVRRHGGEPKSSAYSSLVLRNCISAGASQSIHYEKVNPEDGSSVVGPVRQTPRIRRNDRCPCGSGKKFKKCCGQ